MDYVWTIIEPYVRLVLEAIIMGVNIFIIIRSYTKKTFNKNFTLLNSTYNVDTFSQRVAEKWRVKR